MKLLLVTVLFSVAMALAAELPDAQQTLRLRLETPRKTLFITALQTAKITSLKKVIEKRTGIKQDRQLVVSGDQVLSGDKLLSDYSLKENSQVIVTELPSRMFETPVNLTELNNYNRLNIAYFD